MEKMKVKRSSLLATDLGLRIVAVIIAVIIWLFLSITEYPTIQKTITNVPVVFSMDGTAAAEKGLQALGYKDITVDVEIKGMNYEIGSYGANDLVAQVDLGDVTKEGTYQLDITVKSTHSSDTVSVVSVSPDTVPVNFVHISTDIFEVSASAPNVSAEQGMTLRSPVVSPSKVTVEGAESELSKIKRVEAVVEDTSVLSEASSMTTEKVVYYDENGKRLDGSKYTLVDNKSFEVSFDVYKKKTLNLTVVFKDVPTGFNTATIPYTLSESAINVITPKLNDVSVQTISLGTVSLSDIDEGKSFTFDVNQKLQSGEINQSGIDTVTMEFDFQSRNYIKKEFTIPSSAIKIINPPTGRNINVETIQIPSVKFFGPEAEISNLKLSDITATVDLSDITSTGTVSHTVKIYAASSSSVWCIGTHEVQIDIEEKAAASGSDSSSSSAKAD